MRPLDGRRSKELWRSVLAQRVVAARRARARAVRAVRLRRRRRRAAPARRHAAARQSLATQRSPRACAPRRSRAGTRPGSPTASRRGGGSHRRRERRAVAEARRSAASHRLLPHLGGRGAPAAEQAVRHAPLSGSARLWRRAALLASSTAARSDARYSASALRESCDLRGRRAARRAPPSRRARQQSHEIARRHLRRRRPREVATFTRRGESAPTSSRCRPSRRGAHRKLARQLWRRSQSPATARGRGLATDLSDWCVCTRN